MEQLFRLISDEPTLVAKSGPEHGSVSIGIPFFTGFLKHLDGQALKTYLSLAMLADYTPEGYKGSVIDMVCRLQGATRAEAIDAVEILAKSGLARVRRRYLRDPKDLHDWKWELDGEYKFETTPALLVETDSHRLLELLTAKDPAGFPEIDGEEAKVMEIQRIISENYRTAQEILVTIGPRDMRKCELWYRKYGYGPDMVKALLRYCLSLGKADTGYADAVAREWHNQGVKTTDDVERYIAQYEETKGKYARIRKRLGRYDGLTQDEKDLYDKWLSDWGFSEDVILTACKATTKARTASFAYIDTVLSNWRTAGVKTVEDAEAELSKVKQGRPGTSGQGRKFAGKPHEAPANQNLSNPGQIGLPTTGRRPEDAQYYADYLKLELEMLDSLETVDKDK